ncbi:MAG: GreA/GreB family elongation factor, partial [Mycobacteriales bacterium]
PVRADIVRKIEAARDEGDLKENGGYHAAKEEQGKLEARIRQLTQLLQHVRVGETPSGEVVEEGCLVTCDYGTPGNEDLETFLYANRENATDEGGRIGSLDVYSPESPIGQALAGHKVGDEVVFGPRDTKVVIRGIKPYTS